MEYSFLEILILLLLGLLFGKETILPAILKKLGFTNGNNKQNDLLTEMQRLSSHFNHETTALLTEIRDNTKDTVNKLHELEKYGFPPRDCPKE